ncbi:MAG TPA: tyrosine-protein phosphatase [Isosphaeraceae bacterium]|nr:tyrosine-protein phosphatase [Isosphaeraceae bacterium]
MVWIVAADNPRSIRQRLALAGKRAGTAVAALVFAGSISLGWVFRRPWFEGNLAVLDPGRVIRSAQPTRQLRRWIDGFQLRAILNLRGGSRADWWYDSEVAAAEAHGVAFYDLPLSATRRPTRRELLFLIDVLERCPYPLLIHCKSGADRTGLASALYLMVKRNQPPELAENAFALEFGHVPFLGTEHLHEPLHEYATWLKVRGLAHSPERFRAWVKTEYRSADPPVDPPLLPPGPRQ